MPLIGRMLDDFVMPSTFRREWKNNLIESGLKDFPRGSSDIRIEITRWLLNEILEVLPKPSESTTQYNQRILRKRFEDCTLTTEAQTKLQTQILQKAFNYVSADTQDDKQLLASEVNILLNFVTHDESIKIWILKKIKEDDEKEEGAKILKIGGIALACMVGGVALAPLALAGIGFGSGGVVAGSIAASIHSAIGNVAAGSLFAACQSAGAAGIGAGTNAAIAAASGAVGGGIAAMNQRNA